MTRPLRCGFGAALFFASACNSSPPAGDANSGLGQGGSGMAGSGGSAAGMTTSGGSSGMAGAMPGAGSSSGGSNAAGTTSQAGSNGGGGASSGGMGPMPMAGTSSGGMSTGGGGGMSMGGEASAGMSSGGQPTTGGSGQGGSSSGGSVMPSEGCTGGNPDTNITESIVSFPDSYDGTTPLPMIFGFHGAGRTNQQFREVDASTGGSALEDEYIMVYLKSSGNDWTGQAQANADRLDTAYGEMVSRNCVDLNHVFAIGHSSGAQFITQRLCAGEDRWAGVAPVASSRYCDSFDPLPVLYIQGQNDAERGGGNGQDVVNAIVDSNGCGSSSSYDQASCNSQGGGSVDPGCVEYADCSQRTIWCSHDDPHYSGTNHGWPCFANDAIFDFFQAIP